MKSKTKTLKRKKQNRVFQTKKIFYNLKGNDRIFRRDCPVSLVSYEENKSNEHNQNKLNLFHLTIKNNKKNRENQNNRKKNSKRNLSETRLGKREFVKLLNSNFAPHTIKPAVDYYDFINYKWLQHISLKEQQKYITQIDDFRLRQHDVYETIHEIIKNYIFSNDKKDKKDKKDKHFPNHHKTNMRNYYLSVLKMNSTFDTKQRIQRLLTLIDQFKQEDEEPWRIMAHFNKFRYCKFRCPFQFSISPDEKQSTIFRMRLDAHTFDILDVNVYYDGNEKDPSVHRYKATYRNTYRRFCKELFDTLLGKGHGYDTDTIYDVEVDIFNAMGCLVKTISEKEEKETYHKLLSKDLLDTYGFNITEFCKHLGFSRTPQYILTSTLNYLKCGTELVVKNWKTEKWNAYWVYIQLSAYCRFTKEWENIYFNFFGKFERGQLAMNETDAVSAALYMSLPYNQFLSEKFIAKTANPEILNYVNILSKDLLEVFKKIITNNTWLQSATKVAALEKLNKLTFTIGFPETLANDPDETYQKNTFIGNLDKISLYYTKRFIALEGEKVIDLPEVDWSTYPLKFIGNQPYIVNASYTPSKNNIYINLGYLQEPFIDLKERGIEYNLSNIGYTLAHEMSHCLDDWGSRYDGNGNLSDWWTKKDKKHFEAIQKDVIRQYEVFAKRDNITFDASIGIGEDLADISGLAICEYYLRDVLDQNRDIIPIRRKSFETFYIYFAFQQKQKVNDRALNAQLKTNPHPLSKYRCNVPLSRSVIFRGLYNVKRGDQMWWHTTDMVWLTD
jgi:predicted metalloendopeptidase